MKGISFRNITITVIVATLCFVSLAGAGGEGKESEIEVELLWERTFEGDINSLSMSSDGSVVLVNTSKFNGDKVTVARYLLNHKNDYLKQDRNEGMYEGEGKIAWIDSSKGRLYGVLSPNGDYIITRDGVENLEGVRLSSVAGLQVAAGEMEVPIFSPSKKYVAVQPGYESDHLFLRLFNPLQGLLWKYEDTTYYHEHKSFTLVSCFMGDESLMVFLNGKVMLRSPQNGREFWEVDLFQKGKLPLSDYGYGILPTKDGAIVFTYFLYPEPDEIFYVDNEGVIKWTRSLPNGISLVKTGKRSIAVYTGKNLISFDDKTGNMLWERPYSGSSFMFIPKRDYLFLSGLFDKEYEESTKHKDRSACLYIVNNQGKILWQSMKMPWREGANIHVEFSVSDDTMIIAYRNTLRFYSITYTD